MYNLAIKGGKKVRTKLFPSQYDLVKNKSKYLNKIKKIFGKGVLSAYRGNFGDNYMGGPLVREVEAKMQTMFEARALVVNSCTSALWIACAAIGLKPGDEVIVTPMSMTCSATVPLFFGAIPVFADVKEDTVNLDPDSIESKITPRTKAIIVVDLFGRLADWNRINRIAEKHGLYTIEDAAQAIGAHDYISGQAAGTFGDIGCFSFTQGKHLTCGEGGAILTKNEDLYYKCAGIRNHAEAVANDNRFAKMLIGTQTVGMNLRMTELQAAVLSIQLHGLEKDIIKRRKNAFLLHNQLSGLPFIRPSGILDVPTMSPEHSYYVLDWRFDMSKMEYPKINRDTFIEAVKAELTEEVNRIDRGVQFGCGYIKPLYLMPLFQEFTHWAFQRIRSDKLLKQYRENYKHGSCPTAEKLNTINLFLTLYHSLDLKSRDIKDIGKAFEKVNTYREELVECK